MHVWRDMCALLPMPVGLSKTSRQERSVRVFVLIFVLQHVRWMCLTDGVGWYHDYSIHECVMNCDESLGLGDFCGGVAERWEEILLYNTAEACCNNKLWWMKLAECVPAYGFRG